jgi:UPF0755 protein
MTEEKSPIGTDKTEPDQQAVTASEPVSPAIKAEPTAHSENATKSDAFTSEAGVLSPVPSAETARTKPRGFMRRMIVRSPAAAIHPETVPEPPQHIEAERKERPLTNFLSGLLSFIAIFAACLAGLFLLAERQIYAPGPLENDKVVLVRGSTSEVIDRLEREGVVDKAFLLTLYWQLTGRASQIKGGEYQFKREASLDQVTTTLIEGKTIKHSLTIAEGKTSQEIIELMLADINLAGQIKDIPKEGTLLPETYKFDFGMARSKLLDHMTQEQMKLVREIWAKRDPDLPLASPQDLVILASIVEKETGKADERPRVAGVFVNRLMKKMRLESDPTVVYGLVGGKGSLGRGLTKAELDQSTPYNTYTLPGLPAGPITNPGRAALEAVANPSRTKDLFFVADGTGGHVFAETYEQHLKNVAKWRQIEGQKSDPVPGVATPAAPANTTSKSTAASDTADSSKTPTTATPKTAPPAKAPAKPVKKKTTTPDAGTVGAAAPD